VPSLEQIIRPFVVDPTTPPIPYITTANKPPPDLVRLSIGIGGTSLSNLAQNNPNVAPIAPPPPPPPTPPPTKPTITMKTLSSSHSLSATWYMQGVVKEQSGKGAQGYDPFGKGGTFF
jgi:hypothetical protein